MNFKNFIKNTCAGAVIGIAMLIPGVSGGTLAVLMGCYEKIIDAVNGLLKDFIKSFLYLLPFAVGAVLGIAALYFPLYYALLYAKFPTIMLFAGFMAGSLPKLFKDGAKDFKPLNLISFALPLIAVILICFIPAMGDVNLGADMQVETYFILILMGLLSSCALVVPGVSGSLLLFIFGYYQPILDTVHVLFTNFGHSVSVLALFALGIIIGFFSIAKLMKYFMKRFPRGTNWAILGFVTGSVPAIFLTKEFASSSFDAVHICIGVILCLAGIIASFAIGAYAESRNAKTENRDIAAETQVNDQTNLPE